MYFIIYLLLYMNTYMMCAKILYKYIFLHASLSPHGETLMLDRDVYRSNTTNIALQLQFQAIYFGFSYI